jgi:hypothetical protein
MATRTLWLTLVCGLLGCDGTDAQPGSTNGGGARDASERGDGDGDDDGGVGDGGGHPSGEPCDLSGSWIVQHTTTSVALGAQLLATNWSYHRFERVADGAFEITESLDCGYAVRGATEVSIGDDTLEAMAQQASNAVGTRVRFAQGEDGRCELETSRIYAIRGADKARFLDAVWSVGDPDVELDAFELPIDEASGMQDWDDDGHEGITQLTSFGDRYTAQLDWHSLQGTADAHAGRFGGEGVLRADFDSRESISSQTPALLRTISTPMPPGYGHFVRVDDTLDTEVAEARRELAICKQVQAIAVDTLGDPPRP